MTSLCIDTGAWSAIIAALATTSVAIACATSVYVVRQLKRGSGWRE